MKLKKMIMIAGLGSLAYYLMKKRSSSNERNKKGSLGGFIKEAVHDLRKPLNEVDDDIDKVPASMSTH